MTYKIFLSARYFLALACFGIGFSSSATTRYWNGNVSEDWGDANNFQSSGANLPGVPQPYDTVIAENWAVRPALLITNTYAPLLDIYISRDMTVTNNAVLESQYFKVGNNGSATLNVNGGAVSADNHMDVGGYAGGTATLNVIAGSVTVGGFYLNLNAVSSGASYVNLTGGTVTAFGPLSINTTHPCLLNLAGGTLILPDNFNNLNNATYWINNSHSIVAYNGSGTVDVDTTTSPGNIILTGVPGAPISTRYWNGNFSQDWANPNNFQSAGSNLPGVPEAGNDINLESWAVREPLINTGGHAWLDEVHVGKSMTITNGGALSTTYFKVAEVASATLSLKGGSLWASNHIDIGGYQGASALVNVTGGALNAGGLYLNLQNSTNLTVGGSQMHLTGGTVTASSLSISEIHPSVLNIAGGTLVLPSSQLGNVRYWMNDGAISGYGVADSTNRFNIDQTSVPGSLIITALNPGFDNQNFLAWNPDAISSLPSNLDQAMAQVPPGMTILTNAAYSFGSAVAQNGDVYFTEFGNARIMKYTPSSGALSTVVSSRPGVFGIAVDSNGDIFYGQDLGAGNGKVVWRTPGGTEQNIMTGITVPKQITTDAAGNAYVVLEWGQIQKWTRSSGTVSTVLSTPPVPQGVAVAPDGRIYFCTYGRGGGTGTILSQGAVWVRETSGTVHILAGGFGRGRGMALAPNGDLYVAAEANVWDNGNSGLLVKIGTNGVVTRVLSGIDYPQYPSAGSNGKIYFTLARDNKLACYDPQHGFVPQTAPVPGVALSAEGATWQQTVGANIPFQLTLTNTNNTSDNMVISGYLQLTSNSGKAGMWWNVPATNLSISLAQIPNGAGNTNSGMFQLPSASVVWPLGPAQVSVMPLRQHKRCRWPMTNPGNAELEAPAADFGEAPVSYLVYVSVPTPPSLKIQAWSGNQVRISWPSSATGFSLQRSSTVSGGYANPGLPVNVEGSESVSYDSAGAAARFYRLVK